MTIRILFDNTFGEMAKGNKFKVEDKKFKLDAKKLLIKQAKHMRNSYECWLANLSPVVVAFLWIQFVNAYYIIVIVAFSFSFYSDYVNSW